MSSFIDMVKSPAGSAFVAQGNEAFALGVMHAGYHAADGYPGTPSTEVIDKYLSRVQDKIKVGWSVNEAVAVAVGIGHSIAGDDTLVTMKTPGAFQAGDPITTSAFYTAEAGAFVLYVASDYIPSSTQHVIDLKYFFASARIPVLEPRDHQEMYDIAFEAADISRKFRTPVVVLASGILAHSEGLIRTKEPRKTAPKELGKDVKNWIIMPGVARKNYDEATQKRIPAVQQYFENSKLTGQTLNPESDTGIIVSGETTIILKEVLTRLKLQPNILTLSALYPVPEKNIEEFAGKIKGKILIYEDGDRFLEEKIRLLGINAVGKEKNSVITNWTPELLMSDLCAKLGIECGFTPRKMDAEPLKRPPSICPGCPYKAFGLTVNKFKQSGRIYASFGDIGCSTLLYFMNALDTVLCMGAGDSVRQGFVLSRPEYAHKCISIIGDSCECHSGLDATRNAVFRNTPGVKVVLDNRITAMTGGQPAPSSEKNLAGENNKFNLIRALEAEEAKVIAADSYNLKEVEKVLSQALSDAENGIYTTLVLEGPCIHQVPSKAKARKVQFNREKCRRCGKCNMCQGIEFDEDKYPHFTLLCTNCAGQDQVCMQVCPFGAIEFITEDEKYSAPALPEAAEPALDKIDPAGLPSSLRVAVRGIGGQGNLFLGKVLAEVALNTPYSEKHIVKGDTHGMAQLGGAVISTFACGNVNSPVLLPKTADVIVVMERSEILREGFLDLLKDGGTVILNSYKAMPPRTGIADYPKDAVIDKILEGFKIIKIDAEKIAKSFGDEQGKTANVIVLGVLSTIDPFNKIPEGVWVGALKKLSPNENIFRANIIAFNGGRSHAGKRIN
jgi:indolepyruvate ferredoxin oxidoreductase, alpha subunit